MVVRYLSNTKLVNVLKWFGIVFCFLIAIIGNYIYREYNVFVRMCVIFIIVVIAILLILSTNKVKCIVQFSCESYIELKKVIWPSYQETLYVTLVVILVTSIMSLILWGLDAILVRIISFGLKL